MAKNVVKISVVIDGVEQQRKQKKLYWNFGPVSEQDIIGPVGDIMQTVTNTQQAHVQTTDKKGSPAPMQSPSSSDTHVVSVVPDAADPSKALLVAGVPGTAVFTAAPGVTLDITVTGGPAFAIVVGTVEEQP